MANLIIQKGTRNIILNEKAYKALGEPEFVEVTIDIPAKVMRLESSVEQAYGAIKVNRPNEEDITFLTGINGLVSMVFDFCKLHENTRYVFQLTTRNTVELDKGEIVES